MAENQTELLSAKKMAMSIISGERSPEPDLIRNVNDILVKFPKDVDAQALWMRLDNMYPRKKQETNDAKSFFRRLFKRS